jgi:hypothetical protein
MGMAHPRQQVELKDQTGTLVPGEVSNPLPNPLANFFSTVMLNEDISGMVNEDGGPMVTEGVVRN